MQVDFDARVAYAVREAKERQRAQREEREAHEKRRAAIEKQAILDVERNRQREIERKYGATRRRRAEATERLGAVFAVQEHVVRGGIVAPSPTKAPVVEGPGGVLVVASGGGVAAVRQLAAAAAPGLAAHDRQLATATAPAMAAQSRDRITGRPVDTPTKGPKAARPGSGNMGRGVAAAGGGAGLGSAAYDAAAAYLSMRKRDGTW